MEDFPSHFRRRHDRFKPGRLAAGRSVRRYWLTRMPFRFRLGIKNIFSEQIAGFAHSRTPLKAESGANRPNPGAASGDIAENVCEFQGVGDASMPRTGTQGKREASRWRSALAAIATTMGWREMAAEYSLSMWETSSQMSPPRWQPAHRPPSCRRPSAEARCEVSRPAATMPFRPRSRVGCQCALLLRLPIRDSGIPVEKYFYFSHAGIRARLPLSHCRDGTPRVLMSARPPRLDRRPGHQLGPPCPRTGMPRPAPPPGAGRTLTSKGRKP